MRFPELDKSKKEFPKVADEVARLEGYLDQVLARPILRPDHSYDHAAYDIVPILVAKALGVDEGFALLLLRLAEEAGVIAHRYDVYCPNTQQLIAKFTSKNELPLEIVCPFESRVVHTIEEYFVEVVFNFTRQFALEHGLAVSM